MQAMPMHDLGIASFVEHIDCDGLALGHPQEWTGSLTVIANRFHPPAGRQFNGDLANAECDVRSRLARSSSVLSGAAYGQGRGPGRQRKKSAAC